MSTNEDLLIALDDDDINDMNNDIKKIENIHKTRGYRDGFSTAKGENLQLGFDEKFPEGSNLGLKVGRILGKLHMLDALFGANNPALNQDYKRAMVELQIANILSEKNFDQDLNLIECKLKVIKKWDDTCLDYFKEYF